jgi:uncharacterized membrane protein YesL
MNLSFSLDGWEYFWLAMLSFLDVMMKGFCMCFDCLVIQLLAATVDIGPLFFGCSLDICLLWLAPFAFNMYEWALRVLA